MCVWGGVYMCVHAYVAVPTVCAHVKLGGWHWYLLLFYALCIVLCICMGL